MALADVYDALISRKRYKPDLPHEAVVEMIREQRGIHFDSGVVDAFPALENVFAKIAERFPDEVEPYAHQAAPYPG